MGVAGRLSGTVSPFRAEQGTSLVFSYFSPELMTTQLSLNSVLIQKTKIMASDPITSWEIDGETVETVSDFIFLGSKISADGDCSHEIKRRLLGDFHGKRSLTGYSP